MLRNSIVAGNSSVSTGPDVNGPVVSAGYNLVGQTDGGTGWRTTDLTGTSATPLDPQLGPLQDNGGPTPTIAALAGSPAQAHGDPELVTSLDQRGSVRSALFSNHRPTIGAVEATDAFRLKVLAPDQVTAGEPFSLTVIALDRWGNVATTYTGTVHFSSTDFDAQLPDDYTFAAADGGAHIFDAVLQTAGPQTIQVQDTSSAFLATAVSLFVDDGSGVMPVGLDSHHPRRA